MLDKILNTRILEKGLDASWKKNEAISQNIANVDTPGYKAKTVEFKQHLNSALSKNTFTGRKTHAKHITIGSPANLEEIQPKITIDNNNLSIRLDGNNVDIEGEMAALAKNSIEYDTLTQSLNKRFHTLKSAISEGRR